MKFGRVRFATMQITKKPAAPVGNGRLFVPSHVPNESGDIIFHFTTNPIRLVQEELSVAERRFGVLINRYDDRLDVVVASTRQIVTSAKYRSASHAAFTRSRCIGREIMGPTP